MKKDLQKLLGQWREYANGHYCLTYNKEMGEGLKVAANGLEALLNEPRPTKRAADVKPRRAAKVKSRKVSRG